MPYLNQQQIVSKMKKLIVLSIIVFTLVSCKQKEVSSSVKGNGFKVELLFEKDGVKVYRFMDNLNYHYFTSKGETMSSMQSGNTSYEENIK